jgi:TPR repeat protein
MPLLLICCKSLPPATIKSIPIYDYAKANEELVNKAMETYYSCCGKSLCGGCRYTIHKTSNNDEKCPFCNSDRVNKTREEKIEEIMKRVEVNDAFSIYMLGNHYYNGVGFQQDHTKAMDLYARAAELGYSKAHNRLSSFYHKGGDMKKAKFHLEAAAMAGHEGARYNLGNLEAKSGNMERAIKHWTIGASTGCYRAIDDLRIFFEHGLVDREYIDSILTAYNNSCIEMRSEARGEYIDAGRTD